MALTPKDVHEKQFSTVKMRTGYDMDEVDTFLDEVESAIGQLQTENDDLKAQIAQAPKLPPAPASVSMTDAQKKWDEAQKALADASAKVTEAQAKDKDADAKLADAKAKLAEAEAKEKAAETKLTEARRVATATQAPAAAAAPPAPAAPAAAPAVVAAAAMATPAPASQDVPARAFAMLEAAQRTADETVASAKSEADTILTKAREEAKKVTGALDDQRASLETKVNELRTFERTYRTKLRDTISGQLAELDKVTSVEPKAPTP